VFIFLRLDLQITLRANCGVAALGGVCLGIIHEADRTFSVGFGDT